MIHDEEKASSSREDRPTVKSVAQKYRDRIESVILDLSREITDLEFLAKIGKANKVGKEKYTGGILPDSWFLRKGLTELKMTLWSMDRAQWSEGT